MDIPEYLEVNKDYANFCPQGEGSLRETIVLVGNAILFCRKEGILRLLVDLTLRTGHPPPTIMERYWIAQEWAEKARGRVAVGIVVRPEVIDPEKFEVTAALNAGQTANVFTSKSEALEWLLRQRRQ
ncbi:MAG: hypothetical protein JWQ71_1627 [Pedosphaera sp.]|nr:hypothetical protein [Pedosphaera sp.]